MNAKGSEVTAVESKSKQLRSGYTTGACAAAAAKAAMVMLVRNGECGLRSEQRIEMVGIPFPDGRRVVFNVHRAELSAEGEQCVARASIIKDAGDDPDITNGAEIVATVRLLANKDRIADHSEVIIKGGRGVGVVTKPGLATPIGEAAINPVPRKMILEAVREAIKESDVIDAPNRQAPIADQQFLVTISVPNGEELAKKTLNHRLGIVGGISILGTTGIVRPLSAEAWTATVSSSMDVAKAAGIGTIVVSSGRTSEKAHMKRYHFPDEAYAMMGDYLEFSLQEAKRHAFSAVHLCAQWAKLIKTAMGIPQTHVRHGALEAEHARDFLVNMGISLPDDHAFNTSREIYDFITHPPHSGERAGVRGDSALSLVCSAAKRYAEGITSGIPVKVHLVSYEGDILAESE